MNGRKYLVLTELFLPTKGGTAVWFDEVYRRLGGKDVHILTATVPGDETHDRGHPNTIHRLDLQRHPWLRPASLLMYLRLVTKGMSLAMHHDFEAVHAGRVLPEGLCGWLIARATRRPLVIYAHGEEITNWRRAPRRLRAMSFAYRHADRVIANSGFTREELLKLGVASERIEIIHPGVDLERFRPGCAVRDLRESIGITDAQKLVLSVGRLTRRKGFDHIIRSIPRLLDAGIDVHHAIIGIGEDQQYLLEEARNAGVTDRVHLLGHIEAEDLPRWYCAADVFAMPNREVGSDTEGFGMVFVEAAACGTPSIAGQAGGTGSAVLDGKTGLRVDGADLNAVAAALERMLGKERLAAQLGPFALERARTEFSWEQVAAKTAAL